MTNKQINPTTNYSHIETPVAGVPRRREQRASLQRPRIAPRLHHLAQVHHHRARLLLLPRRAQPHHRQPRAALRVHLQRTVQQLEQMLADLLRLRGVRRLVVQVPVADHVLRVTSPARRHHADRLSGGGVATVREQRGVLQQRLAAHHAADARLRHTPPRLRPVAHAAVRDDLRVSGRNGKHGNAQVRADRADRVPVAIAAILPLLLLSAAVHCEEESALFLQHFAGAQSVLQRGEEANLHRKGDLLAVEPMDDGAHTVEVREQVGAIAAFSGNALRTAQIQIDVLAEGCNDFGCADYILGIVAAQLQIRQRGSSDLNHERCILGAGGEVVFEVPLARGQQVGMEHLRETQVAVVVPHQHAKGQVALLHLGVMNRNGPNHGSQDTLEWD